MHEGKQQGPGRGRRGRRAGAGVRRPGRLSDAHEQVFRALTQAQEERGGEAVYLDEVARGSGMPPDRVRALLHDLARVHRLVTVLEQTDTPDTGPCFEVKPRL